MVVDLHMTPCTWSYFAALFWSSIEYLQYCRTVDMADDMIGNLLQYLNMFTPVTLSRISLYDIGSSLLHKCNGALADGAVWKESS